MRCYDIHLQCHRETVFNVMLYIVFVCVVLKKAKHRLVEKMKDSTADTLGLSRAVLVNGQ